MSKATNVDIFQYQSDFVAGDNCLGKQRATWSSWYIQPSKTGAYGDPTVATAEMGKLIMDGAVANGVRFLKEYWSP
jgi:creatinine amidohydrolase/Fe(II)-dependent formamide hydrolase-like protein